MAADGSSDLLLRMLRAREESCVDVIAKDLRNDMRGSPFAVELRSASILSFGKSRQIPMRGVQILRGAPN